jgi:hypothetical protein
MTRTFLAVAVLMLLAGCKGVGLSNFDLEEAPPPPGLNKMDVGVEESKKSKEWWDGFYGNTPAKAAEPNCDFYGNCKTQSSGSGW